ncbi:UbiH/UbiF family hydroxylase [uncultured Roseibium sp.]|uniref:UbiH/UbiF family hydroxylase n=1 Tax=uncultured Roseibium sp. TaxID=1936171 RepID=UPI00259753AA|nr:UbiH/UbiF family hydroxylase [uncultured Roseibium sp.]
MPETSDKIHDIVVVGAGPSGLTAALLFASAGFETVLVAPAVNLQDGRTTALLQDSVTLFEQIGVWESLRGLATPLSKMRMIDDTGRLVRAPEVTFDSAELDLEAFGYNLRNKDLNRVLAEVAQEQANLTLVEDLAGSYDFGDENVTVSCQDGMPIKARLLVAADGRNSQAREAAGIDLRRWSYPQVAVVLNLEHDRPHHDTSTEFHTPTGPFTLVPLPGRSSSLVCVVTPEQSETLKAMPEADLALELEQRAHSILGKFRIASEPQSFPLSSLSAKSLVGKRLALIGETAHVFPPIGAQGLNLGLRDVASLGKLLTSARGTGADIGAAQVLSRYESGRRSDISTRTFAVDALNRSLLTDFLPVQIARSAGLYLADKVPPLRRLLMREGIAPGTKRKASPVRDGVH